MTEAPEYEKQTLDEDRVDVDISGASDHAPHRDSRTAVDARMRAGRRPPPGTSKQRQASRKITRTDVNFWLDSTLLVVFLALIFVTVVVRFIFPSVEDAAQWRLWSWTMTEWLDAQFVILCIFSLGILLHLMLHWTWICGVITQRILRGNGKRQNWDDGKRTIFGVGLMIVILNILGGLIAVAALMIQHP